MFATTSGQLELEKNIIKYIKDNISSIGVQVGTIDEIKANFGQDITGIDMLIVKDNTILALKCKSASPNVEDITHFVYCCDDIAKRYSKTINKVWISNAPLYGVPEFVSKKHSMANVSNYNNQELANTVIANIKHMFGVNTVAPTVAAPTVAAPTIAAPTVAAPSYWSSATPSYWSSTPATSTTTSLTGSTNYSFGGQSLYTTPTYAAPTYSFGNK